MARPTKTTIDYFPHYADRTDETLLRIVEREYGNDGYAFWFKIRERLCNQPGLFLSRNNVTEWEFLLTITRQSEDSADNMLELLAKIGVIDAELWHKQRIVWIQRLADDVADVYVRRKTPPPTRPGGDGTEKVSYDTNATHDEFMSTETTLSGVIVAGIPSEIEQDGVSADKSTQTKLNQIKQQQTTTGSVDDGNILTRMTTILGITVAQRWLTERGPAYCQAQLALVDNKAATIASARAYLLAALAGNYAKHLPPAPKPDPHCPQCGGRGVVIDFERSNVSPCSCVPRPASAVQQPPQQQAAAPDPNRRDTAALTARVTADLTP